MSFNPDSPPPSPDAGPGDVQDNTPAAWLDDLRVAAIFFTRVPIQRDGALELGDLARAWRVVPAIGVPIGLVGAIVYSLAYGLGLPALAAAILAVLTTALVTGALHEDGLGDFADGSGGDSAERRIEIMRDSRIGAFGTLALIFSVGLRVAALAAIAKPMAVILALIVAHAVSRAAIPVAMDRMTPAAPLGLGAGAGAPDRTSVVIAAITAGALALILLGVGPGVAALIAAGLAAFAMAAAAERLLGGFTGDVLGAVQQAAEAAMLLACAATLV